MYTYLLEVLIYFLFSMFKWLTKLPLSHYSVLDPQFMRGSYNGIGMASHLLGVLNGTQYDKPKEDEQAPDND